MMIIKKIIYLLIILVAFLFLIFYSRYFPILVFIQALILPIVLFIILIFMKRGASVVVEKGNIYYRKGQKIDINLAINNKSIFPISRLEIKLLFENNYFDSVEKIIRTNVNGYDKTSIYFSMDNEHCGVYKIKIKEVKVFDYISLFSKKKKVMIETEKYVLPELFDVNLKNGLSSFSKIESDVFSSYKSGDDPSEVFQVREYIQGDKMQKIHWKLSSKCDELMVKDFSLPMSKGLYILIEYYMKDNYLVFEKLIEAAFSISNYLVIHNIEHNIMLYDCVNDNIIDFKVNSKEDLDLILKEAIKLSVYTKENYLIKKFNCLELARHSSKIIYFTTNIDKETYLEINIIKKEDSSFKCILFTSEVNDEISLDNQNNEIEVVNTSNTINSLEKIIL